VTSPAPTAAVLDARDHRVWNGSDGFHITEQTLLRRHVGLDWHDDPHFMSHLLLSRIAVSYFPHRADASQRRRWAEFSVDRCLRACAAPVAARQQHSNQHRSFP
jgi:hypothetical protein